MKIDYSTRFLKHLQKAPVFIQLAFQKRLEMFVADSHHELLHTHALHGKWKGFLSINVTGDWRAVYHWLDKEKMELVEFIEIGTHSELYK